MELLSMQIQTPVTHRSELRKRDDDTAKEVIWGSGDAQ
jgi:hypothetical protein